METRHYYDELDEPRQLANPNDWINQECSTPGCYVVIRSRIGHQAPGLPTCKWCEAGVSHVMRPVAEQLRKPAGNIGKVELELV